MNHETVTVAVSLEDGSSIRCYLYYEPAFPITQLDVLEALAFGEAPIQLSEAGSYEYVLPPGYYLQPIPRIVAAGRARPNSGRIKPGNFVGTLSLEIMENKGHTKMGLLLLEVCAEKTDYRTDYRFMLEDITAKCTELLLQYKSPFYQNLVPNPNQTALTIYQRFAFVKSILESPDFTESVYRIQENPNTRWTHQEEKVRMEKPRRINSGMLKQLATANRRTPLHETHPLSVQLPSLPTVIVTQGKRETVDTPENRFVKYVLNEFLHFCSGTRSKFDPETRAYREAIQLESILENMLGHAVFKAISQPSLLALNSPVLQRREGYRELLRAWLTFDLAARLNWAGGEDVYTAGKRDVATLYEYWVFFVLLDLYGKIFNIDPVSIGELLGPTDDGLGLQIRKGSQTKIAGHYISEGRKLQAEFSFNRNFPEKRAYPEGGSWTARMRPDYTLSLWPQGMTAESAEQQELMIHLHFDAKYKIEHATSKSEEEGITYGKHKREDLLKMHSYRDAIRRTAGAYILYPGDQNFQQSAFHESLPGIGAFRLHPSREDSGIPELEGFIREAIEHLLDYASQREELAYRVFEIHQQKTRLPVKTKLPGFDSTMGRHLPASAIKVLVGFCKNAAHEGWINERGMYNIRTGNGKEILALGSELIGVRFLLLHGKKKPVTGDIREIAATPPRVLSRIELRAMGYPSPAHPTYLVFELLANSLADFGGATWNVRELPGYRDGRQSGIPFLVSLADLLKASV